MKVRWISRSRPTLFSTTFISKSIHLKHAYLFSILNDWNSIRNNRLEEQGTPFVGRLQMKIQWQITLKSCPNGRHSCHCISYSLSIEVRHDLISCLFVNIFAVFANILQLCFQSMVNPTTATMTRSRM